MADAVGLPARAPNRIGVTPGGRLAPNVSTANLYTFAGPDDGHFTFVASTAQIRTKAGQTYDHETAQLFFVRVTANDGNGGGATTTVVIRIGDIDEPPSAPTGLTHVQNHPTSMTVSWTPPVDAGRPAVTSYDLQYKKTGESAWTAGPQGETEAIATLTRLDPSTTYQVQVRANNDEGAGPWTSSLTSSTPSSAPGISISRTTRTVIEGDQTGATHLVILASQPTESVTVLVSQPGTVRPNPGSLVLGSTPIGGRIVR